MKIFNTNFKAVEQLGEDYLAFIQTSELEVEAKPNETLGKLSVIVEFEKKRKKALKSFVKYLILSPVALIFGTTIISLILISIGQNEINENYNFTLFTRNIAVVLAIICVYHLIKLIRFKVIRFSSNIETLVLPALHKILSKYQSTRLLSLKLDLNEFSEKESFETEVDRLTHTHHIDLWFSGAVQSKSQEKLEWKIKNHVVEIRTSRNSRQGYYTLEYEVYHKNKSIKRTSEPNHLLISDYKRTIDISLLEGMIDEALSIGSTQSI